MPLLERHIPKTVAWALCCCVVVGYPVTSWIYYPAIGKAGLLPPDGDSIMIPMTESLYFAAFALPIAVTVTLLCLRGADGVGAVFAWDKDRPILSGLVAIFFGVPFFLGLLAVFDILGAPILSARGPELLWALYDFMWLPYHTIVLAWLALMQGSVLTKRRVD